ncbi:MAG: Hsp70 family protein [Clostridiales bacterium]|jgi:molecular chaperone DnaK|nr:Hsp70 family protein [Clostridiales bacterium]
MFVGIDLGTSTSEIAFLNSDGKPEVIPNLDGELTTPSAVYINEDNEPVVGMAALNMNLSEPESTFIEVKRQMGRDKVLKARGVQYTPAKISSFILRYLVDCAEAYLNEKVDRAVITVPAYFTDRQRRDTIKAGELAGIEVERIINEPTAAALDYSAENPNEAKSILVYDLGGGTLDVTVLELYDGAMDVKSSCGNNSLGGKDFDELLMNRILKKIQEKHRVNLARDIAVVSKLKRLSEECKKHLSSNLEYEATLPFLFKNKNNPVGYEEKITRKEFEQLIQSAVSSTFVQIETALSEAGIRAQNIDMVLLVGGSTRIPLVSRLLMDALDFEPRKFVDPDLAVVRGAAIQTGIIEGSLRKGKAIILTDVCPYSLSTEVLSGFTPHPRLLCDILIKRNSTIPATISKIYYTCYDDQDTVEIKAFQGESEERAENVFLDKFLLRGIPKSKAGHEKIKVFFSYDLNGILTVGAECVSNGVSKSISINTSNSGKAEQIEDIAPGGASVESWTDSRSAGNYKTLISRAEKIVDSVGDDAPEAVKSLMNAVEELKRGLVLGLGEDDLEDLKDGVLDAIGELS